MSNVVDRAQGCLLGQFAGDSLGSLVEFQQPSSIRNRYPGGVRELSDGGTWNTIAGQPTDDSEMAISLARTLVERGKFDAEAVRRAYVSWLESKPFDCGMTTATGLRGQPRMGSQANGAMMRISPLGIFGAFCEPEDVGNWARQDAKITHPNPVCLQASAIFATAISYSVKNGPDGKSLYSHVLKSAKGIELEPVLRSAIEEAADRPPANFVFQQGWVIIAFQNALWQLLHSQDLEGALVDTVMRGGDTDTNAAICGALLGSIHGRGAIPTQWENSILNCRPEAGNPRVRQPRPSQFWPTDALDLAVQLLVAGSGGKFQP